MKATRLILPVFALTVLAVAAVQPSRGTASGTLALIENYQSWAKVNPEPAALPIEVWTACEPPRGRAAIATHVNPHRSNKRYITVFVNGTGKDAMMKSAHPSFPEGSVIVKQKLLTKDAKTPELLTVMVKRQKGLSPASGDWEYIVTDGNGKQIEAQGFLKNCQSCHALNKDTDYVFRSYLTEATRKGLH